jgi:hypothetical protein
MSADVRIKIQDYEVVRGSVKNVIGFVCFRMVPKMTKDAFNF